MATVEVFDLELMHRELVLDLFDVMENGRLTLCALNDRQVWEIGTAASALLNACRAELTRRCEGGA